MASAESAYILELMHQMYYKVCKDACFAFNWVDSSISQLKLFGHLHLDGM